MDLHLSVDGCARAERASPVRPNGLPVERQASLSALPLPVLSSREEAGDVAQDVAVEALRSLGRLRDPDAFDAWVHRIAVRRAGRALRRRRRRVQQEVGLGSLAEPDEPVSERRDLDEVLALRQELQAGLAQLPVKQQLALVLRYVHDLSDEDIAAALGCRPGTVHALLSRGRAALKRYIERDQVFEPVEGGCR